MAESPSWWNEIITTVVGGTVAAVTWGARTVIRHDADIRLLQQQVQTNHEAMRQSLERIEKAVESQSSYCRSVLSDPTRHHRREE